MTVTAEHTHHWWADRMRSGFSCSICQVMRRQVMWNAVTRLDADLAELEHLRAELQAREAAVLLMEAVVEAVQALQEPHMDKLDFDRRVADWAALLRALDAVPRRAGMGEVA